MDHNQKFELNDETLDQASGGRQTYGVQPQYACAICKNACSSCGGHDFRITDRQNAHYHGTCKSCGTYNMFICRIDYADAEFYWEWGDASDIPKWEGYGS